MLGYFWGVISTRFVKRKVHPQGGFQPAQASTKEKFDIEGIWKTRFMRSLAAMDRHYCFCDVGLFGQYP